MEQPHNVYLEQFSHDFIFSVAITPANVQKESHRQTVLSVEKVHRTPLVGSAHWGLEIGRYHPKDKDKHNVLQRLRERERPNRRPVHLLQPAPPTTKLPT